jgi:hypothetical protein
MVRGRVSGIGEGERKRDGGRDDGEWEGVQD